MRWLGAGGLPPGERAGYGRVVDLWIPGGFLARVSARLNRVCEFSHKQFVSSQQTHTQAARGRGDPRHWQCLVAVIVRSRAGVGSVVQVFRDSLPDNRFQPRHHSTIPLATALAHTLVQIVAAQVNGQELANNG